MADIVAAKIVIPVTTNAGKAKSELGDLDESLKGLGKSSDKAVKKTAKMAKGFSRLGRALIAGGIVFGIVKIGKHLVKLASAAEETENKFNVTFSSLQNEAQKTAASFAANFGLAEQASQKLLSDTGDLLTGFQFTQAEALALSEQVNILAGDLASFSNIEGGTERASKALTSALLGETESVKSLGIVIRQADVMQRVAAKGMGNLTGMALMQAKAQATLEIATEQSKNALGDFERSQDSAANVARRVNARLTDMQTELGEKLLTPIRNAGLAFLNLARDGGIVGKVLTALLNIIGDAINGLSLLALKTQELVNESRVDDFIDQQKDLNKQLRKTVTGLKALGFTEEEINRIRKDGVAITKNNTLEEMILVGALLKVQKKRVAIWKAAQDASQEAMGTRDVMNKIIAGSEAAVGKIAEAHNKSAIAATAAKKGLKDYRMEALRALADAGDLTAQLKVMDIEFVKQIEVVRKAGLDTAMLEQLQQNKRLEAISKFVRASGDIESQGFDQRQDTLDATYGSVLANEELSYQERLAAQQAFNDQSAAISKARMVEIDNHAQVAGGIALQGISLGQKIADLKNAQIEAEIEAMKKRGATEEEIEAKRSELAVKQAKDAKTFGIFNAIVNTALAVTKALASLPPPANFIAAGLSAALGAAEVATISATPLPSAQFGMSGVVPPGNEADSGLVRVNSGEKIDVTPTRFSGVGSESSQMTLVIDDQQFNAFLTDKMNQNLNNGSVQIRRKGAVKIA